MIDNIIINTNYIEISKQKNDEANVLLEHETKYTTNRQRDLHTREYVS